MTDNEMTTAHHHRQLVADVVHMVADHAQSPATVARAGALNKMWRVGVGLHLAATCVKTGTLDEAVAGLPRVRLHVSHETAIKQLKRIEHCTGDEGTLRRVCRGPRPLLDHLQVGGAVDSALLHVKVLRQLKSLDLSWSSAVTESGLASVMTELGQLQQLGLSGMSAATSERSLASFVKELRQLRCLILPRSAITDSGLAQIKLVRGLRSIDLSHCRGVTNSGLAHVKELRQLQSLSLGDTRVTDCGLEQHVKEMRELQFLDLTHTAVTEVGVEHLKDLPHLQSEHLKDLPHLQSLCLSFCWAVKSSALVYVEHIRQLQSLDLSGCFSVTDGDLVHIRGLPDLRSLSLANTRVSDAGLGELHALPQLRSLDLTGCFAVTEKGMELVRHIPDVRR